MSNGYKLELLPSRVGGCCFLAFWDNVHGDDVVFEIKANGVVTRTIRGEAEDGSEDQEIVTNLAHEILALNERLYGSDGND